MLKAFNESNGARTFGTNNHSSLGPNVVVEYDPGVTGVSLASACKEVNVGWSGYISATVYPSSAPNRTVYWSSSDRNVADVDRYTGLICSRGPGSTVITVTTADGGFTARCTLTVSQVLTGADTYITDQNTRNTIIGYKTAYDYVQNAYNSGILTYSQKTEQQNELSKAADLARADFVILNPQSNFVYRYFKGRNYQTGDIGPFNRMSYTYPNSGYNDPKDTLAVMIIQRSLELLGYFEPPDDYDYGIYDSDTHEAVLSSPFYIIGSNDFQNYSYYDMLGSTTASQRTQSGIQLLRQMRLFHNEVAAWVAQKADARIIHTTINGAGRVGQYGYADVMKTGSGVEYIWEVKPWADKYRVAGGIGAKQISRYINAWNNYPQNWTPKYTAVPGYNIGKFAFPSAVAGNIILVESNPALPTDPRSGLVHYKPISPSAYTPQLQAEYSFETESVAVPEPAYSYAFANSWSLGNADIQGVAMVAGVVVLVVAVGAIIYFCPPAAVGALAFI